DEVDPRGRDLVGRDLEGQPRALRARFGRIASGQGAAAEGEDRQRDLDAARAQLVGPGRDDLVLPGVLDARAAVGGAPGLDLPGDVTAGRDQAAQLDIDV